MTWRRGNEVKLVINSACYWNGYAKEPIQGKEELIGVDPDGSVFLLMVLVCTPSASFRGRAPLGMLTVKRYVSPLNGGLAPEMIRFQRCHFLMTSNTNHPPHSLRGDSLRFPKLSK